MSLANDLQILRARTAEFCAEAAPIGGKIKTLRHVLGSSKAGAERVASGRMLTLTQLMALARYYGRDFVEFVFADVSEADVKEREERVGRFLAAVRQERENEQNAKTGTLADLAGGYLPRPAQLEPRSPGAASAGLINERLSLDRISLFPRLKDHLDRFRARLGRIEIPEAVATARADAESRTGVVTRQIGDIPRLGYRARTNRLNSLKAGDPITAGADSAYAALTLKTIAEAEASAEPVLARLSGSVRRGDRVIRTDVAVLRTVDRTKHGVAISSHFVPLLV